MTILYALVSHAPLLSTHRPLAAVLALFNNIMMMLYALVSRDPLPSTRVAHCVTISSVNYRNIYSRTSFFTVHTLAPPCPQQLARIVVVRAYLGMGVVDSPMLSKLSWLGHSALCDCKEEV